MKNENIVAGVCIVLALIAVGGIIWLVVRRGGSCPPKKQPQRPTESAVQPEVPEEEEASSPSDALANTYGGAETATSNSSWDEFTSADDLSLMLDINAGNM
jgi:hypothetical protein